MARRKQRGDGTSHEAGLCQRFDARALGIGQYWRLQPQQPALLWLRLEQIAFGADRGDKRCNDLLANAIQRRIGHLSKELFKIIRQQLWAVGKHGQRRVVAHRSNRFGGIGCHRRQNNAQIFERVAVGPLQFEQTRRLARNARGPPWLDSVRRTIAVGMGFVNGFLPLAGCDRIPR